MKTQKIKLTAKIGEENIEAQGDIYFLIYAQDFLESEEENNAIAYHHAGHIGLLKPISKNEIDNCLMKIVQDKPRNYEIYIQTEEKLFNIFELKREGFMYLFYCKRIMSL